MNKSSLDEIAGSFNPLGSQLHELASLNTMDTTRKLLDTLDTTKPFRQVLNRVNELENSRNILSARNMSHELQKTLNRARDIGNRCSIVDSLDRVKAYKEALESTIGRYEDFANRIDAVTSRTKLMSSELDATIAKTLSVTSSVQQATKSLSALTFQANKLAKFSTSSKQLELLRTTESFRRAMDSFAIPRNFQEAISKANFEIEATDIELDDGDVRQRIDELSHAKDEHDFSHKFSQLPQFIQVFMITAMVHLLWPVISNVIANLITPHVVSVIQSSNKPERELIKEIVSLRVDNVDLGQHRFVTKNSIRLYEEPSGKSAILDSLSLGQVLTVISREKNWLEVSFEYDDGEYIQGWVYARYTAKFNNR